MTRRGSGRITIVDVAREAGVSVSTISRVIRDHQDVGLETRARVQDAIERLDYRPSLIARALVRGETRLLALLVSDFTNPFYPQLARSIENEAGRAGYTVVICNTQDRPKDTRRHLERLLGQGIDGVIHASAGRDEGTVLSLVGDHRRVVFTNRPPKSSTVSSVVSDNFEGANALTRHLLSLGHRRVLFVGGPSYARNATERQHGFIEAMRGLPDAQPIIRRGEFSRASGERAVEEWLVSDLPATAIIAVNDSVALGAMEAVLRAGLRVPDDVALAGFDGTEFGASPVMSLTSVDQRSEEMGRLAVQILLGQIGVPDFEPTKRVLPTRLLIRASTAGTAAPEPDAIQLALTEPREARAARATV